MLKNTVFGGLGLVFFAIPLITSALPPPLPSVEGGGGGGGGGPGQACRVFEMNLRYGMTDNDSFGAVSTLQQILIDQGYLNIEAPTGYFGRLTFRAVKVLQADNDIPNTGFVGPITRGFLNSLPCKGADTTTFSASPTSGPAPLSVEFSAKSISPSYRIYFGDGQKYMFTANDTPECVAPPPGSTYDPDYCTTWRTSHTYTAAGTYTATLSYQPTCTAPQDAVCMLAPEEVRGTVTITVTSPATPTGTLSVSTDPSSPAYSLAVAGTSGVTLGAFRFSAKGEDVRLDRVGISLADSAYSGDITQLTLWDGGSLVATAVITGSKLIAISTAFSNFTIPRDSSRLLTIKGDLAAIGVGQPGRAGDLVRVNITSDTYGIGVSSGSSIQLGSSGEQSAGVRVFRTVPTVARITPSSSTLIAQVGFTLYQFSIKADAANDLSIYQVTPVIGVSSPSSANGSVSVSNLKIYAYTDSSFSSGVPGFTDGQVAAISTVSNGRNAVVLSSPLTIPKGQTYYFNIRADVTQTPGNAGSSGSVTTNLAGDTSYAADTATQISSSSFVWSPNDLNMSAPSDRDWTNGFGVSGLPSGGTDSFTLTK